MCSDNIQWCVHDCLFFQYNAPPLAEQIINSALSLLRHLYFAQKYGFLQSGSGRNLARVEQFFGCRYQLSLSSMCRVCVYLCIRYVEAATSHFFFSQHALSSSPLKSLYYGVFDFTQALHSLCCIDEQIRALVLWAETPHSARIVFVPAVVGGQQRLLVVLLCLLLLLMVLAFLLLLWLRLFDFGFETVQHGERHFLVFDILC